MKAKILVVDDEQNMLKSLQRVFLGTKHEIYTAASGVEALETLAKRKIDLVISDMSMPEMSGYQLLSKVKELYPSTIRVSINGCTDELEICKALMDGSAKMFIEKPFNNKEIIKTVEQLLSY